jgi:ketosteroid isomerase-like protein
VFQAHRWLGLLVFCAVCTEADLAAHGQQAEAQDLDVVTETSDQQTHDELRALRDRMFAMYEKRDMDGLLADVAPDVVITWQNADRNEGHEEFLQFYDAMMNGENRIVEDVSSEFSVDGLSTLYGEDTAIARGTLVDHFRLSNGSDFRLDSKWTATVVKLDGAWKVASFHVSSNIFENAILSYAQGWLIRVGLIGGLLGLVCGLVIGRKTKRV